MNAWEERILDREEAREEGRTQGQLQGEERINLLNQKLIDDGRLDELKRAAKDKSFQKQILKEYGID